MYAQSGVWVIISKLRPYLMEKYIKSLRFRIVLLLMLVGVVPSIITKTQVIYGYEERAVDVRIAEIKNQCTILCNQIGNLGYLSTEISKNVHTELHHLSTIYNGRVMVIDDEFQIIEDTYDLEKGKTIIAANVIECFSGKESSHYDGEAKYTLRGSTHIPNKSALSNLNAVIRRELLPSGSQRRSHPNFRTLSHQPSALFSGKKGLMSLSTI